MADPKMERVLVVPRAAFDEIGSFQGFSRDAARYLPALLTPERMEYRPRSEVEDDPSWKQIIPYVVLRERESIFCYARGASQAESRLHARLSLGVGGHVSEHDKTAMYVDEHAYVPALLRELAEEIEITGRWALSGPIGLINDDSNDVGRVHLGIVHEVAILNATGRFSVSSRESGIVPLGFMTNAGLSLIADRFESWSRLYIESLARGDS